jgi:hypothetical protein
VALCPRLRLQAGALHGRRGDGDRGGGVGRLICVEKPLGSCSHRVSRTPRLGFRSRCGTGTPTHGIRQGTGHVGLQRAVSADSAGATPAGFPRTSGTVCRRRATSGGEGGGAGQRLTVSWSVPWRNCRCRSTLVPVNRQDGGADRQGTRAHRLQT